MSLQPESQSADDLYATLAISAEEARSGTSRTLLLPDGRQLPITLPAGIQSGQRLSLAGLGRRREDGTYGSLQLTISVLPGPPETGPATPSPAEEAPTQLSSQAAHLAARHISSPPFATAAQPASPTSSQEQGPGGLSASMPSLPRTWAAPTQRSASRPRGGPWLIVSLVALLLLVGSGLLLLVLHQQQQASEQADATATSAAASASVATRQANEQASAVARATAAAQATASVLTAYPNPYPPGGGQLVLYTPLSDSPSSIGWETGPHCSFRGGAYHVVSQDPRYFESCSNGISYSDFALEVEMTIVQGDQGGLLFRGADIDHEKYYLFQVSTAGLYTLFAYTGGNEAQELTRGLALSYQRGLGETNLLALVARGSSLTIYLNREPVLRINDGRYRAGQLALLAVPFVRGGQVTDVAYRNLKVWTF
ncbi:hypothetical protein [Thermogemmatispora sp.]|uniref:hypothetical protein n=1 Tax=Thermogemmatispora sp. TaxID=1968838 RepID=UPI0035E428EB